MAERDYAQVARDMNVLAEFEGVRDVCELTPSAVEAFCGLVKLDVLVLFGGAPLVGADVLAGAMRAGVARAYAIVGGIGHTTPAFRASVRELCPSVSFSDDASEAEVFEAYLETRYGLRADLLECESTNCGENVTNLRALLSDRGVGCGSIGLIHDASMQRRMSALVEKEMLGILRLNYASHQARVIADGEALRFATDILGMWDMEHWLSLLMGEITRLNDNEHGYGPSGAGYIAHVDVPAEVTAAWERLRAAYPTSVRAAVPKSA